MWCSYIMSGQHQQCYDNQFVDLDVGLVGLHVFSQVSVTIQLAGIFFFSPVNHQGLYQGYDNSAWCLIFVVSVMSRHYVFVFDSCTCCVCVCGYWVNVVCSPKEFKVQFGYQSVNGKTPQKLDCYIQHFDHIQIGSVPMGVKCF